MSAAEQPDAGSLRTGLSGGLLHRSRILLTLCMLGLLVPLFSPWLGNADNTVAWLFDLATHWQWLFLAGLLLAGGIAAWQDSRWALPILAAPLPWLTASEPAPTGAAGSPILSVATANVHVGNQNPQPLIRWLEESRPDVVFIQEVSPEYAESLKALNEYPYRRIEPAYSPFGIAVLSRIPLQTEVLKDADGISTIEAQAVWQNQPLRLTGLHPMPPLSAHYHAERNRLLRAQAMAAAGSGMPSIVAGDLNASPWSSAFGGLAEQGLRRASGLAPTWPAIARGWMGIPIDHILVSRHWSVVDSSVGPDIGSDHRPILARLSLR